MDCDAFYLALERMGLIAYGDRPELTPLTGGVSSDIVRVDLAQGPVCIKRALAKLKVEADWQAPVERNRWEREWMRTAAAIVPDAAPEVIADDNASGMFVMKYLEPDRYPVWKTQLRDGAINIETATQVGLRIAAIHGATAGRSEVAQAFSTDHIFVPIRIDPYLRATAGKHPQCAQRLEALAKITATTKKALVHGDVSPKNILAGPRGPVFLDAECAWYGDPAFDLAFCLNHLLLKCVWQPRWIGKYLACYDALASAYLDRVDWEAVSEIEARTAHLLPGLLLGRIDGKSPVEYIQSDLKRDLVRDIAIKVLQDPLNTLTGVREAWEQHLIRN